MTDYSKMSDFEINKAVAFHIGLATVIFAENGDFAPCSNPADAWPIIFENKISLINLDDEWGARAKSDSIAHRVIHDRPLRAAMIVFLMMKDAENAPAI